MFNDISCSAAHARTILLNLAVVLGAGWAVGAAQAAPLDAFRSHVRTATWTEEWPGADSNFEVREVTAELWTDAIHEALKQDGSVEIPKREKPYYLDAPIVLSSGQSLKADKNAEIRLKPGTNTCMVRNERIRDFSDQPVSNEMEADSNILLEGGIWTTLSVGVPGLNGNRAGRSDRANSVPNCNGAILLSNVRNVVVRHVTIRRCGSFGVHLGNVNQFVVDGIRFEDNGRDGVHVNGPASHGVIQDIAGVTHDDLVALNAWEWRNYTPTFGAIHHVRVERVTGAPPGSKATDAIRLLPGVKRFADGDTLDCPIHDIVLRDLTDIREFKLYDQPNLEVGRDKDFSAAMGKMRRIEMMQLTFHRPGVIQIAADVEGMSLFEVGLNFTPAPGFKLVKIGPMSGTYRHGEEASRWVEIFSPDRDVTVQGLRMGTVKLNDQPVADAITRFVQVKDQRINVDYPRITPRGGTGKARLEP